MSVVLAAALVAVGAFLYRIYPEYQRLRRAQAELEREAAYTTTPSTGRPVPKPVVAQLYFARLVDGKQRMVAITRELPPGLPPAEAALEELIRGEVPRGCDRPLPRGTELCGVRVSDGIASADFSEALRSGFPGGSDTEGVTVYAIVNTLTALPGIDKAQLLIEGQRVNEIGGHLYVGEPLVYDGELVVAHP
jgi:spore germination protein GerM